MSLKYCIYRNIRHPHSQSSFLGKCLYSTFNFTHDFKVTPPLCLSYSSASEQEVKKQLKILVSWDVTLYWNSITPPKACIFSSNNVKPGSCKEDSVEEMCWSSPTCDWMRSFESGNIERVSAHNSNSWNLIITFWHNETTLYTLKYV
jgi:hypothetical protein